jgi:pimeloyl-ACP methyl ester carboxylesterase
MPHATRDDVSLYYERAGSGDPAFVFVHGWCCDRTFFEPQYEHFKATSSVMTYDLRGCGRSDRPAHGYEIPALADDLAWLCDALGISRPIVVGHSLGGLIGLDLAVRHPSLPAAIVAVDPGPIDPLPQSRSALGALAEKLEKVDEDPRRDYVASLLLPTDDLDRGDRIIETMCSVPPSIAAAALRGLLEWDGVAALERCDVPLLVLLAKVGGSNDPARLLPLRPDIHIGVTVGAGHFHQLDAHEQVTAMIERFVRIAA